MNKPEISSNFTIEDIHKVREYNHETTKNMSFFERKKYYDTKANEFKSLLRKNNMEHGDYTKERTDNGKSVMDVVNEIRAKQK